MYSGNKFKEEIIMPKVTINGCIGCGACTAVAPDVLEINGDGVAESIYGEDVADDFADDVNAAAEACPVSAITVE